MANYPDSVYAPRDKENLAGVVYDASKKTIGFVEDFTLFEAEVLAMIADLVGAGQAGGLKGGAASFFAAWTAQHSTTGGHDSIASDTIAEGPGGDGVTIDEVKLKDGEVNSLPIPLTKQTAALVTSVSDSANLPDASRASFVVAATGDYLIYGQTMAYATTVADIKLRIKTGSATYASATLRLYKTQSPPDDRYGSVSGSVITTLTAGDTVHLGIACNGASGTRKIAGNSDATYCTSIYAIRIY